MGMRVIETQPNDRIVVVNEKLLLKFIGWCEAHRAALGEYEPGFLAQCITDLECASDGYALDATAECGACGEEHPLRDAEAHFYRDGEWYCKNRDECNERSSVTCAGCGTKHYSGSPDVFYDADVDGWFCNNSEKCDLCRMGEAS